MQKKDAKAIGSRVMAFLKKNIHYILMILCVIAIGVVVTVVAVLNTDKTNVDVNKPGDPSIEVPKDDDDDTPTIVEKKFALELPVAGGEVVRAFSDTALSYNPTLSRYDAHLAVDLMGKEGSNVIAGFEGTVTAVTSDAYNGGTVTIDYGKGHVGTFKLLNDVKVKKGDKVTEKTVIGKIGIFQFECKEQPHIHFELTENNKLVDPMLFVVGDNK